MPDVFSIEDFVETKMYLGQGQFGIVYRTQKKSDQEIVVLKECLSERNKDVFWNEISILYHLNHPCIPRLIGYIKQPLTVVMEWKPGQNLADFISHPSPYGDGIETILTIAIGIANILCFLHRKKILYRDLKPDNILFDSSKNQVYLIDFGLAMSLGEDPFIRGGIVGTKGFLAPEILKKKMYSFPADVYSFGRTVYCLFVFPYYERNKRLPGMNQVDPFFACLINRCCKRNPSNRPTMEKVLESLLDFEWKDERSCLDRCKNALTCCLV